MEGSFGEPELDAPLPDPRPAKRRGRRVLVLATAFLAAAVLWGPLVNAITGGGRDSYEFMRVDPSSGDPVTWDHCSAIRYQVNPEGAPENWREVVEGAFNDIEANSEFVFLDAGETRNRVLSGAYTPGATRGEPVLIIWSSQGRMHSLQGDTIGLGGGAAIQVGGRMRLVTGSIALDREAHSRPHDPMSTRAQQLVLEHEIGHVLGLDHVDDDRQLMAPAFGGQKGLGPGDINGLEALHAVPCG